MIAPPLRGTAPERRHDLALRVVRANIISGRLRPGTVLLEGPIAALLQTSRAPVKKALQSLEAERLIHTFDGRGYLVGPPTSRPEPQRVDLRQLGLEISEDIEVALQSRGSWEPIYVAVEAAVASCLVFGEYRMIESDIATHFNVSRTVVRDVLGRLQERGLIRKSQTSRWIAGPLTARSIRDRFELRKVLEPMALVAAAAHWDREPISQLRIRAEAARQHSGDAPFSGSDELEAALLQCTVLQAPNAQLVALIQQNLLPLNAANRILTQLGLPSDRVAIDEQCLLLDLILNDFIESASALLREHLALAAQRSIARLKIVAVIPDPVSFAPYLLRV
jgi:DNA-binding GntR family transcriptional regulator